MSQRITRRLCHCSFVKKLGLDWRQKQDSVYGRSRMAPASHAIGKISISEGNLIAVLCHLRKTLNRALP